MKGQNKIFSATAHKDGRWWLVDVPELDVTGQALSVAEAEDVAREVIGLALDVDPETVSVVVAIVIPDDVQYTWDLSKSQQAAAVAQGRQAARLARQAVQALRRDGYTYRDAGLALGISPQRAQQLVASVEREE